MTETLAGDWLLGGRWGVIIGLGLLTLLCGLCCRRLLKIPSSYRAYYQAPLWWGLLASLGSLFLQNLTDALPEVKKFFALFLRYGTWQALAICVLMIMVFLGNKWRRFPGLRPGLILLLGAEAAGVIGRYRPRDSLSSFLDLALLGLEILGLGFIGYALWRFDRELRTATREMKRRRSEGSQAAQPASPPPES
jgi:uncharacterized membrane protein